MKRIKWAGRLLSILLLFFAAGELSFAQDPRLVLEAGGLRDAGEPRLVGDHILFSYRFLNTTREGQIHSVAAAFQHENFSELHEYSVNENGILVLLLPHSRDVDVYRYRLVVDGVWGPDPRALRQTTDRWGVSLSEYLPPSIAARAVSYPWIFEDGYVEFMITAEAGQMVALVGSFNGWDPFMTPMVETEPGMYHRVLRLTKGEHLYYYMVDGRRFADPGNGNTRWNVDGMIVSAVTLP